MFKVLKITSFSISLAIRYVVSIAFITDFHTNMHFFFKNGKTTMGTKMGTILLTQMRCLQRDYDTPEYM